MTQGIQKTRYLYQPETMVTPVISSLVSQIPPADEDTKYDFELSKRFIRLDADGDGLTNDVLGFGLISKTRETFLRGTYEVKPFYYLIRNSDTPQEKGVKVYLLGVKDSFDKARFRDSIGEDCDYEYGCTAKAMKAEAKHFETTYVPGTFERVEGEVVPQVDVFLQSYKNTDDAKPTTEQTRINLKDFTIIDYARE